MAAPEPIHRRGRVTLHALQGKVLACALDVALQEVAPDKPPFTKTLPNEYINEAGNNVLNSFREYVSPLVGELPRSGWFEQIT